MVTTIENSIVKLRPMFILLGHLKTECQEEDWHQRHIRLLVVVVVLLLHPSPGDFVPFLCWFSGVVTTIENNIKLRPLFIIIIGTLN